MKKILDEREMQNKQTNKQKRQRQQNKGDRSYSETVRAK